MTWLRFKLIRKPYHDKDGNATDITGKSNKPGVDEFKGGGKVWPPIRSNVLRQFVMGDYVIVETDLTEQAVNTMFAQSVTKSVDISPKAKLSYTMQDFKVKIITEEEAKGILESTGYMSKKAESGMTR